MRLHERAKRSHFSFALFMFSEESSSVPQEKGRVERIFQTLQSHLPVELRLAVIATVNEANE